MRWVSRMCVFGVLVLGCATQLQPVDYLNQATGSASEEEVRSKFGPPLMQVPGDGGRTVWIYRYAGVSAASPNMVEELWCYEHALTFGRDKILQQWIRQECHQ